MEVAAFYLPSLGRKEEIEQGMAGKRTDLYQRMLVELSEQIGFMDEHGYYGAGTTEHHFHIEGEEVSTNPVLLNLYFGLRTKRMKFGQLGNVLPCLNPVNRAEDIAIASQMLQGRVFAGFARGYQGRWVNVLGQHYGLGEPGKGEDYEELKRSLFEEHFDIMMTAWKHDTFSYHGKHWQIPTPGIQWPAAKTSRAYGKGVDENGIIQEIGIAPGLYNNQIPDLFMPFATSERSIQWAMERGVVPVTIMTHPDVVRGHFLAGQEAAQRAGLDYKYGQGMAMSREVIVADTDEEAERIARDAGAFIWCNFFQPFGFNAAIATPEEKNPFTVPNSFEAISERGLVIHGSPDTVNRKLEALFKQLPVDYFWMFIYNHMPHDALMRSLELLTTRVWPNFSDKIRG
ncbi:LLM class flavin-dependent oxidoreductase [Panacagrimonas sp.]|uniref:LLM class flavin-dependent oxidoreductase n=1 Tax=Panacagrimonas sp. TaxID=2480088 RepID=UPI003B51C686